MFCRHFAKIDQKDTIFFRSKKGQKIAKSFYIWQTVSTKAKWQPWLATLTGMITMAPMPITVELSLVSIARSAILHLVESACATFETECRSDLPEGLIRLVKNLNVASKPFL
jgi:hypothetical protein